MTLIIKKGKISNLNETVQSFGRNGNVNSIHSTSFRLNNQAASIKLETHNNFSNGDMVTAAGEMKSRGFVIHALRNETTGTWHSPNTLIPVLMSLCMILIGVITLIFIIGFVPLFYGCYTLYQVNKVEQAKKLLKAHKA